MEEGAYQPLQQQPAPGSGMRLPLLVALVIGVAVVGGILWLGPPAPEETALPAPVELPPLGPAEEAYLGQLEFSGLQLSRWQNFLDQTVVYLDGTLANQGDRTIRALEVTLEFRDILGQVVLRTTARVVGNTRRAAPPSTVPPLPANQTRDFRLAFEDLPADWNQAPPNLRVSGLLLE